MNRERQKRQKRHTEEAACQGVQRRRWRQQQQQQQRQWQNAEAAAATVRGAEAAPRLRDRLRGGPLLEQHVALAAVGAVRQCILPACNRGSGNERQIGCESHGWHRAFKSLRLLGRGRSAGATRPAGQVQGRAKG